MASLADIKLPTRDEAEDRLSLVKEVVDYTYSGWGSMFNLEEFNIEGKAAGTYYPSEGNIGFSSVYIPYDEPIIQPQKHVKLSELVAGMVISPDTGYDALSSIIIDNE